MEVPSLSLLKSLLYKKQNQLPTLLPVASDVVDGDL